MYRTTSSNTLFTLGFLALSGAALSGCMGESDSHVTLEVTTPDHVQVLTFVGPPDSAEDFRDALLGELQGDYSPVDAAGQFAIALDDTSSYEGTIVLPEDLSYGDSDPNVPIYLANGAAKALAVEYGLELVEGFETGDDGISSVQQAEINLGVNCFKDHCDPKCPSRPPECTTGGGGGGMSAYCGFSCAMCAAYDTMCWTCAQCMWDQWF